MHASVPVLELDRGSALRVLEGRASYGAGCDELVSLLADACAAPSPLELRGEQEALAAFRAAYASRTRLRAVSTAEHGTAADGRGRRSGRSRKASRFGVGQVPARRVAPQVTATPVIGSVLAVAASAAVIVLAYNVSVGLPKIADPTSRSVVSGQVDPRTSGARPASGARPEATVPGQDTAAGVETGSSVTRPGTGSSGGTTQTTGTGGAAAGVPTRDRSIVAAVDPKDETSPSSTPSSSQGEHEGTSSAQSGGSDPSAKTETGSANGGGAAGQSPSTVQPPRGDSQQSGPPGTVDPPKGTGPTQVTTDDHAAKGEDHSATGETPKGAGGQKTSTSTATGKAGSPAKGSSTSTAKGTSGKDDASGKGLPAKAASTSIVAGAGGGGLIAGQAIMATLQEACAAWQTAGGSAGGATLTPQVAVLLADGRTGAAVDLFCADLVVPKG